MKPSICSLLGVLSLLVALLCGCGNSDGTVTLDKAETAELVKLLGTYEGEANPQRIMGAMMTGIWKVTFLQDDNGALKCKCVLQLHDEQNGWGSPTTASADLKVFAGSGNGEYKLSAQGQFSESEPTWSTSIEAISLIGGRPVNTITLFDMASYQITLHRK